MKEYRFRYGDGEVVIPLDEGQVLGELHGNHVPAAASIPDTLRAALENPIGLPPLRQWTKPGERVAPLACARGPGFGCGRIRWSRRWWIICGTSAASRRIT